MTPEAKALPGIDTTLYRQGWQLYVVRADANDRLFVMNTSPVGDLPSLLLLLVLLLVSGSVRVHCLCETGILKTWVRAHLQFKLAGLVKALGCA